MASQQAPQRPCPIASALEVLGERWSLLAIREMTYGVHRFGQIVANTGASRDILAERLRKLEAAGVVERRQYSEHPPRFEYHLTAAGRDLHPTLLGLFQWGVKWVAGTPSVQARHSCGHDVAVRLTCDGCGAQVSKASIEFVPAECHVGFPSDPEC
ncbi:winged helix-turn-helix transcriptional regulator [Actinacidiphila rubida]|uniref:Transcriptional regulator, HxlR family n=1 Tax=Actinacidiphila rubida TaxID=310780 RepID=A0A1H8QNL0_9ACTN|nr:helix-turn-helix domain-containing protein [Actinacidiphila rubida]SEO55557.1 transcriptional regulator, HxlR family [Actinacidiphila rubida]